jgi:hypothetical protein
MTSGAPLITPPRKRTGSLIKLLNAAGAGRLDFRSQAAETLTLDFEGIVGNRHRGWTRAADARVPYLPRGRPIRNTRHLSLVSMEDCAELAARLELETVDPGAIGANAVIAGVPKFSYLPRGTRLLFADGVILAVEDQNAPCVRAGEGLQLANPERKHIKSAFVKAAKGLRGLVVTVEHPGTLTVGEAVTARLPEQWIYA